MVYNLSAPTSQCCTVLVTSQVKFEINIFHAVTLYAGIPPFQAIWEKLFVLNKMIIKNIYLWNMSWHFDINFILGWKKWHFCSLFPFKHINFHIIFTFYIFLLPIFFFFFLNVHFFILWVMLPSGESKKSQKEQSFAIFFASFMLREKNIK